MSYNILNPKLGRGNSMSFNPPGAMSFNSPGNNKFDEDEEEREEEAAGFDDDDDVITPPAPPAPPAGITQEKWNAILSWVKGLGVIDIVAYNGLLAGAGAAMIPALSTYELDICLLDPRINKVLPTGRDRLPAVAGAADFVGFNAVRAAAMIPAGVGLLAIPVAIAANFEVNTWNRINTWLNGIPDHLAPTQDQIDGFLADGGAHGGAALAPNRPRITQGEIELCLTSSDLQIALGPGQPGPAIFTVDIVKWNKIYRWLLSINGVIDRTIEVTRVQYNDFMNDATANVGGNAAPIVTSAQLDRCFKHLRIKIPSGHSNFTAPRAPAPAPTFVGFNEMRATLVLGAPLVGLAPPGAAANIDPAIWNRIDDWLAVRHGVVARMPTIGECNAFLAVGGDGHLTNVLQQITSNELHTSLNAANMYLGMPGITAVHYDGKIKKSRSKKRKSDRKKRKSRSKKRSSKRKSRSRRKSLSSKRKSDGKKRKSRSRRTKRKSEEKKRRTHSRRTKRKSVEKKRKSRSKRRRSIKRKSD